MEWNSGKSHLIRSTFHSHQSPSFNFIHNYNHQYWPGTTETVEEQAMIMMRDTHESTQDAVGMREMVINDENKQVVVQLQQQESSSNEKKKVRMTSEQLEFLESRFQEDIKLEPDRKIKLARELGLQPRQVAVWFQNRRARWKTKQLEHLYFSVKHQLDLVSMEKDKLQQEVVALRAILKEEVARKQQLVWENWNNNNNNNNNNDTDHMISCCKDTIERMPVFSKFRLQKNATARDNGQNNNDNIIANNHELNGASNIIDEYNNNIVVPSLIGTAVMHSYH